MAHDPTILAKLAAKVQAAEQLVAETAAKVAPAHGELMKANKGITHAIELARINAQDAVRAMHAAHANAVMDADAAKQRLDDAKAEMAAYISDPDPEPIAPAAAGQGAGSVMESILDAVTSPIAGRK